MATTARPVKRVKIAVACQRCRVRKVRCDGARPTCLQCMIGQTDCSWPNENGVGPSNGDVSHLFNRTSSPPNIHQTNIHVQRPIEHLNHDLSAHIPRSTPLTHTPLIATDYGQNHIPITPLSFETVQQHHPTLPQHSPNSYSVNSTAPNVDDFNSLQWMMNQLDGGATNASAESAIHASPSSSNTSADVGGQAFNRNRMLATQEKLNNLTWKELYARVYGTYARYLIDVTDIQEDILEDRLQIGNNLTPNDNNSDSQFDHIALADAARALAIRFQGLNDVQEIQNDRVSNAINNAMRHVGSILRHPTHKGILAIGLLSWLLYQQDEARAAFSYCSTAVSQWTVLPQALQTQDGVHSGAWVLYDLVGEMILRSGSETSKAWLDLHQKAFVARDDQDDTSALISANIAVQNAAVAIHQLVSIAEREQGDQKELNNTITSETGRPTFEEIKKLYGNLNIPFATLNAEQISRLDSIEQQASQIYEALPASALFSVTNFTQHDQAGHGAVFLALHTKYEATMCYIYQLRAYSCSDEKEMREAITTSASAARSLADDLVVAEAMAPWAIAANPSLDRYIFLGSLSILISFKMATGSFTITQKPIRTESSQQSTQSTSTKQNNHSSSSTSSKPDSTKKRLLGNVLRQNFTACFHALKLLSKFCLSSSIYLDNLTTITATTETET